MNLTRQLRPAAVSIVALTLLTGCVFPVVLFAIGAPLFSFKAHGSLLTRKDVIVGSRLIGQEFTGDAYFHSRPSAAGNGYDGTSSGGSNLGPTNPKFVDDIRQLAERYRRENRLPADAVIPIDAVTRSASGLDPHISPEDAALQIPRVARARGLSEETLGCIVEEHTHGRQFGILGSRRVAVLELNLALDDLARKH